MEELVTLRKFHTIEEASGLAELLEKNKIEYIVEKTGTPNDIVFAGNTLGTELHIKVKSEDFEAAEKLLGELEEVNVEKLDRDYYLFNFSDQELLDILKKPDEWSLNDYLWAQQILIERGKEVDNNQLEEWKKSRLELLSQPEKVTQSYLLTGYLLCIFGGFIGFFMGRHVSAFRKILPNGQKVFAFDDTSRRKGKKLEITGISVIIAYVVLLIYFISI